MREESSTTSSRQLLVMVLAALREARFEDVKKLDRRWVDEPFTPNPAFALTTMNLGLLSRHFPNGGVWDSELGKQLVELVLAKHSWSKVSPDAVAVGLGRYWKGSLADAMSPNQVFLVDLFLAETLLRLLYPDADDATELIEGELAEVPDYSRDIEVPMCLPLS
jgi:hypothetical protein